MSNKKLRNAFDSQRYDAKRRGIPFLLDFETWLKIWVDSGHLSERGRFRYQYCMARFGDVGPYGVGNVRICTVRENQLEGQSTPAGQKRLQNLIEIGKNPTQTTRKKISVAGKGVPKPPGFGAKIAASNKTREWKAPAGADNPNARLTWEEVREIRKLYKQPKVTLGVLAKKFGVSDSTISNVILGRHYAE